jgi:hypothetical protein
MRIETRDDQIEKSILKQREIFWRRSCFSLAAESVVSRNIRNKKLRDSVRFSKSENADDSAVSCLENINTWFSRFRELGSRSGGIQGGDNTAAVPAALTT